MRTVTRAVVWIKLTDVEHLEEYLAYINYSVDMLFLEYCL